MTDTFSYMRLGRPLAFLTCWLLASPLVAQAIDADADASGPTWTGDMGWHGDRRRHGGMEGMRQHTITPSTHAHARTHT